MAKYSLIKCDMVNTLMQQQQAPCGSWRSPVSSRLIVTDAVSLDEIKLAGASLYYLERRPQEQGRCVIVKHDENKSADILPPPYSARSRVHEYGGGAYCVDNDTVFFVNDSDQAIYCVQQAQVRKITETAGDDFSLRFADLVFDRAHKRLIAVCEKHRQATSGEPTEPVNSLVSIDIDSGDITTLCQGYDFYASPRLDSQGRQLCWLCWNHPNMPWDGNELWLAAIDHHGKPVSPRQLAGYQSTGIDDENNISICQPQWSPDNRLYYISDHSGWWQLYRHEADSDLTAITRGDDELGLPQWVFAQSSYAFIDASRILAYRKTGDKNSLVILQAEAPHRQLTLTTPQDSFSSLAANTEQIAFIGASSELFPAVIQHRSLSALIAQDRPAADFHTVKTSASLAIAPGYLSRAQSLQFKNRHGQTVYANYYAPANADYRPADNERPPLIVICHGGPTGCASTVLDPRKQFWTSRGFALLDVNYSGSTGFGRDYRRRLNGQWGVLDVEDCCDAARYAVAQGLADNDRLIIRGSSAGGYTVLCALTFHPVFSAGASYYGISELETLATDTHKFESRYLDRLVGPWPEAKATYRQRSPLYHTEELDCPVIFFQGIDDRVVPKEQAEKMIEALDKKGIAVASRFFEGEQHGFRQAQTIMETLENELYFYAKIFNFNTDDGKPLTIKSGHQK